MDNITHSLVGWSLGQTGLKEKSRKGLAALILGANMPDIDVFLGSSPWEPLAMHRGFTHGLVGGVLVMPPILFGLLWLLDRWQVRRGAQFKRGLQLRPWWLLGLCYIGTITHPVLDLLTTYSVQLLSPFSGRWFHADALFIIDVWVWATLALAIVHSKRAEQSGDEWRSVPRAALTLVLAYIGVNLMISQAAEARVRSLDPGAQAIFASPPPLRSWRRDIVWRDGASYCRASYDPFGARFNSSGNCAPSNMADPTVRAAIARDPALQRFLRWSVMPQAEISRSRCQVRLVIGDARYGDRRRSLLMRESVFPTGAKGCLLDKSRSSS